MTVKQWILGLLGELVKFALYAACGFALGMIFCSMQGVKQAEFDFDVKKKALTAEIRGSNVSVTKVNGHIAEIYRMLGQKQCKQIAISFNSNEIEVWKNVGHMMKKEFYSTGENPTIGTISYKKGFYTVVGAGLWEGTVYKFKQGDVADAHCRD